MVSERRIQGKKGGFRRGCSVEHLDDFELSRWMRMEAVKSTVNGRGRLALSGRELEKVRRLSRAAVETDNLCKDSGALLERLVQDRRMMEVCAERAHREGMAGLPAAGGSVRIGRIAEVLCGHGDIRLSKDRLMLGLASFNDVQSLEMSEWWSVPQALRWALCREWIEVAGRVVEQSKQRRKAEAWVQGRFVSLRRSEAAFFEHAFCLLGDMEDGKRFDLLERFLMRRRCCGEELISAAHEETARLHMRLDNILHNLQMMEALNWKTCFEMLSSVEAELNYDPSGIYPRMEDASKGSIRAQVASLARDLKLGETTIARMAVNLAQKATDQERAPEWQTVCKWLYDDEGRRTLAKALGAAAPRRRMVPDPSGRRASWGIVVLTAVIYAAYLAVTGSLWLAPLGLPLAWGAAMVLIRRCFSVFAKPVELLKLEVKELPDSCRTLAVMPVLLSSKEYAEEICDRIEAMGSVEHDKNIRWLILGDFPDADTQHREEDEIIAATVRRRVAEMNKRMGETRFFYLHRTRRLLERDGIWMGRDRKRGALMALNRLLLDQGTEGTDFLPDEPAFEALRGQFHYVLTLDADTAMLPGTMHRLIGCMLHPLNRRRQIDGEWRGYSVLQPRMEMRAGGCVNGFIRLFSGTGGLHMYGSSVSDFWQDVTGTGIFFGKGLYEVQAFQMSVEGVLPAGKILSHDLIEGMLAGVALVRDVILYDTAPESLAGTLKRLHRWTRGDWQLLPQLASGQMNSSGGRRLCWAERIRLTDNLMRSLWAPSLLALMLQSIWMGSSEGWVLALGASYLHPLLNFFGHDPEKWRRATGELSILPATAFCCADAIIRTLWRLLVSGRHLLNWVTAADAKGGRNTVRLPGRLSVILLLPGWMIPGWRLATLALSMLFLIGPDWIRDLETTGSGTESHWEGSEEDREMLWALARDTWKFFEETTGAASNGLPPDNLQTDPARQAVHRTSPTNIGLYMMSVIAASELKLIDDQAACERLTQTVAALEKMEKWKGHLYNWHDTHTLSPLSPKYVSSVDSGNLAAALLLCAEATADQKELSDRIRTLAEDMDLSALYDPEKRLFRIGLDAECGRLSDGYYDMLASESRILSYTAVMLGQVPVEHWRMLSRTTAAAEGQQVLVSWGGTMFEYLMPELFMEVPPSTLLGQTVRGVVRLQQMAGKRRERPWGISESGYYAFDLYLNYQYRAFGLQGLAMNGRAREDVVAPYASVLALTVSPEEAVENITHMRHMGWWGRYGFYEAADYTETKREPRLVRSHMAHHQGMILCALAGVLTGRPMRNWFMHNPQARGVALLLEEAPISGRSGRQKKNRAVRSEGRVRSDERIADGRRWIEDTHLLSGGGGMVLLTADGAGYYRKEGLQGSRFGGDLLNRNDGACMHLQDERTGQGTIFGHQKMVYRSGCAVLEARVGTVTGVMRMCVSPEDGAWIRLVELKNQGNRAEEVCVTDCIPLSLGTEGEMYEHPVFRHLFVESKRIAGGAIRHRVRQRSPEKQPPELLHLVSSFGEIRCGTDMDRLTGRLGSVMEPGGIRGIDQRREAAALNPCSVLACRVIVPAGETVTMHFAAGFVYPDAEQEWMERNFAEMTAERSLQLSTMQAVTELEYLGIDAREARMLYRIAALLFDGRLSAREQRYEDREGCSRENLWAAGISGDVPVLLVEIHTEEDIRGFRRILRMHEFYRWLRVPVDLAIVCRFEVHYFRPLADLLGDIIDRSHLGALRGQRGGVHVLEEKRETLPCLRALERFATLRFHSGQDPIQALRRALYPLEHPPAEVREMRLGESCLEPISPDGWNGFGGYLENGSYVIEIAPNRVPPAPWVNMMANDNFGILLTERGGGMIWQGNSRFGRLTAFVNDPLYEGWGWMLYLVDEKRGEFLRLLPGKQPAVAYRVIYEAGQTIYRFETSRIAGETTICVAPEAPELRIRVTVKSAMLGPYRLVGFVDWLMGGTPLDGQMLRTWSTNDACFAAGTWSGVGYFAADHTRVRSGCSRNAFLGRGTVMSPEGILQGGVQGGGWVLNVPIRLTGNESCSVNWVIGCERDAARAQMRVRAFYRAPRYEEMQSRVAERWKEMRGKLQVRVPDRNVNRLANGWLLHQTLTARVRGRTGFYQPGGAYGFRDQLQDMIALLPFDPQRVREHLLRSASKQFCDGDVLHWWHEPAKGVRTRISDDMLFLPYVTARYVRWTGDSQVLGEWVPYLENVDIGEEAETVYREMHTSTRKESLHAHCMRAFRRAASTGVHGLTRMGDGDWNDGMNRVGTEGRGESIWLTEFLSVAASEYAAISPDETDAKWLKDLSRRLCGAVEDAGWDGQWYLRAYTDDGVPLGSANNQSCKIDLISQAWAVMANLRAERCKLAMDAAWQWLVEEENGLIKLLTPPFDGDGSETGYIEAYPPGIRENGGQYTHGACWMLIALIRMGDEQRAHRLLRMLMPMHHAESEAKVNVYRVEPYVMAADIYSGQCTGRGGWTWYTGSAAWMYIAILELLGFERRGDRIRFGPMLGSWEEAELTVVFGKASYRMVSNRKIRKITLDGKSVGTEWIVMEDDGMAHEVHFPPRKI